MKYITNRTGHDYARFLSDKERAEFSSEAHKVHSAAEIGERMSARYPDFRNFIYSFFGIPETENPDEWWSLAQKSDPFEVGDFIQVSGGGMLPAGTTAFVISRMNNTIWKTSKGIVHTDNMQLVRRVKESKTEEKTTTMKVGQRVQIIGDSPDNKSAMHERTIGSFGVVIRENAGIHAECVEVKVEGAGSYYIMPQDLKVVAEAAKEHNVTRDQLVKAYTALVKTSHLRVMIETLLKDNFIQNIITVPEKVIVDAYNHPDVCDPWKDELQKWFPTIKFQKECEELLPAIKAISEYEYTMSAGVWPHDKPLPFFLNQDLAKNKSLVGKALILNTHDFEVVMTNEKRAGGQTMTVVTFKRK